MRLIVYFCFEIHYLTTYIIAQFLSLVQTGARGYNEGMFRNIVSLIKWFLFLAVIISAAFATLIFIKLGQPATTYSYSRDFEIKNGDTAGEIISNLKTAKLVRNALLMKIYLRAKKAEDKLQAGIYILDSNMTIPEIVQILSQGRVKASGVRLTVIEGQNVRGIAQRLENLGLMQAEQFTEAAGLPGVPNNQLPDYSHFEFLKSKPQGASLEGFLFPDSYLVKEDSDAESVVRKMLENFGHRAPSELTYDQLILASIVEREVGRNFKTGTKLSDEQLKTLQEERRIVAGIFTNRLKANIGLESDATLQYVTGSSSSRATIEETKIDSPYNTYKYRGLPPTPIGNPSLDSMEAALSPADTEYLFFLTEGDGTAHYAKTLEEHVQNRAKYLE